MAKLAPPIPRNTPSTSSNVYVGTIGSSSTNAGTEERAIPIRARRLPFTDWNRLPSVTRTIDAASTGTATRKADSVGLSEICLEMNGASGPNITQTVNPVSKYRKQAMRAFQLPLLSAVISCFIRSPDAPAPGVRYRRQAKKNAATLARHFRLIRRIIGSAPRGRQRCLANPVLDSHVGMEDATRVPRSVKTANVPSPPTT